MNTLAHTGFLVSLRQPDKSEDFCEWGSCESVNTKFWNFCFFQYQLGRYIEEQWNTEEANFLSAINVGC